MDYTSGPVIRNPCQCRGHRFDPLSGKIPQCPGPTQPMHHNCWGCAPEPWSRKCWVHLCALGPRLCNKRSHFNKNPVLLQRESSPHSLQLEKSLCSNEDPAQSKLNKCFFKNKTIKKDSTECSLFIKFVFNKISIFKL